MTDDDGSLEPPEWVSRGGVHRAPASPAPPRSALPRTEAPRERRGRAPPDPQRAAGRIRRPDRAAPAPPPFPHRARNRARARGAGRGRRRLVPLGAQPPGEPRRQGRRRDRRGHRDGRDRLHPRGRGRHRLVPGVRPLHDPHPGGAVRPRRVHVPGVARRARRRERAEGGTAQGRRPRADDPARPHAAPDRGSGGEAARAHRRGVPHPRRVRPDPVALPARGRELAGGPARAGHVLPRSRRHRRRDPAAARRHVRLACRRDRARQPQRGRSRPVPDDRRGVAHRAGGRRRRGPAADLGGAAQPAAAGDEAPDRRDRLLREGRL